MESGDGHRVEPLERKYEVASKVDQLRGLGALPPELVDFVFEHTAHDKATIRACTLVSWSWRAVSAPHLFSSLTVMRETGFDDFDGFLGAHPDIASCIRELELKQVPGELDIGFARAAVTPTTLSTLSAKLPRLQVLRLRKMWIFDAFFDSPASARPITQRPRLKALTLHDCTNGSNCALSLRTLHGILETFPADDVSLHYLTIANAPDANTETRWSQLQVRNLTLHHVHAQSPLLDILRQILTPHGLQSLRTRLENTYNLSPEFLRVLSEFLIHVGGSQLRHLELPFTIGSVVDPQEDDPDHWRILQLHTCSELESITFHLHVPLRRSAARTPRTVMTRHGVPVSALLVAFLPHLPPSLRIYTLTSIDAYSPDYVRSQTILHLKRLDNALVARFPMLEKVQIIIRDREWLDDYSQAILQVMPMCRRRGILDIVVCSEE